MELQILSIIAMIVGLVVDGFTIYQLITGHPINGEKKQFLQYIILFVFTVVVVIGVVFFIRLIKSQNSIIPPDTHSVSSTVSSDRIHDVDKSLVEENANVITTGKCGYDCTYTLYDNGVLVISGTGAMNDYRSEENVPWYNERSQITIVKFKGSISNVGDWSFGHCGNLTEVSLSDTINNIGCSAFSGCSRLEKMSIPDSVVYIRDAAFYECEMLADVSFGKSVQNIENWAFGYSGIRKAVLPESVNLIGDTAFFFCSHLTEVTIPKNVKIIGVYVFQCSPMLEKIEVDENNPLYTDVDGILFNKDMTELLSFPGSKSGIYVIPDTVEVIGEGAFQHNKFLKGVVIPISVKKISRACFYGVDNFKEVRYRGTAAQWRKIEIDDENDFIDRSKKIFQYSGE